MAELKNSSAPATPSVRAESPQVTLMLRVRDGDEDAFAELYGHYHRKIADFFYGLCLNAQTASDLCQETFFRIWHVRKRYAATGSFPAYLFSFARHIWLEHCRERRKLFKLGYPNTIEECLNEMQAVRGERPDALAGRSELRAYLEDALDALPEEQRMVFVLRNIEGLSLEEIAAIMECPVNTVRSRKLLAIKKLRSILERTFTK